MKKTVEELQEVKKQLQEARDLAEVTQCDCDKLSELSCKSKLEALEAKKQIETLKAVCEGLMSDCTQVYSLLASKDRLISCLTDKLLQFHEQNNTI